MCVYLHSNHDNYDENNAIFTATQGSTPESELSGEVTSCFVNT